MAVQTYSLHAGRINKFKGQILAHAVPDEVLSRHGRQMKMPQRTGDTYIARRYIPFNATTTNYNTQNRFFQDANGDRGAAYVALHATAEGVTPTPDTMTPVDVQVVVKEYSCLYAYTDKTYHLYEDDIPAEMVKHTGERVTLVNEMVIYGALKASTNAWFSGGTTMGTTDEGLTLGFIRNISSNLQANHGKMVNSVLAAGPNYGTSAVERGYFVFVHTDAEPDIRDLPGFIPAAKYAQGKALDNELGTVERFRFITSPDLVARQNAGAAVGATGLKSTGGANIDVYQFVVAAQDAWSKIAVRGLDSVDPTFLKPGQKSKSDPLGQRGYVGALWWFACMVENDGWLAVGNCGLKEQT